MRAGENREERRGAPDLTCGAHRRRNDAGGLQHTQSLVDKAAKTDNKTRKGLTIGVPRARGVLNLFPSPRQPRSSSTHSHKKTRKQTNQKRLCVNRYGKRSAATLGGGFGDSTRTRWQVSFVSACPRLTSKTSAATAEASRFPRYESTEESWE